MWKTIFGPGGYKLRPSEQGLPHSDAGGVVLGEVEVRAALEQLRACREADLRSTQIGKATDPALGVPLNHTIPWLFKSF